MNTHPEHRTPPPCPQRCWRPVDLRNGWVYTAGTNDCGHHYDHDSGIWRWKNGHPAAAHRDAA